MTALQELRQLECKYTQFVPMGKGRMVGKPYFIEGPYVGVEVTKVKRILEKKYERENLA
jgi:hypothetical protein